MSDLTGAPGEDRSRAPADPAPYAWLDDHNRMAGALSPGATSFIGGFFLVAALVLVVVSVATHHLPGLWMALVWGLLGGQALRMGLARRAWRSRNPGVDPLSTVPSPTGGSAFGPDTRAAAAGRWVLLILCAVLGLLFVIATVQAFAPGSSGSSGASGTATSIGTKALLVILSAVVIAVGWYDLRRILRLRAERRRGSGA